MQDFHVEASHIQRAQERLHDTEEEIQRELEEIGSAAGQLEVAILELGEALGGGQNGEVLLCLRDIQEYKDREEKLMAILDSYWANHISERPSSFISQVMSEEVWDLAASVKLCS